MTEPESLTISIEHRGDVAVLSVRGDVDFETSPAVKAAVKDLIRQGFTGLVIDMSGVTFMSSDGLAILAWAREELGTPGGFAVVADDPVSVRAIELTGLHQIFPLCSSVNEALGIVNSRPPGSAGGGRPPPSHSVDA